MSKTAQENFLPGATTEEDKQDYFGRHIFEINHEQDLEEAPGNWQQTSCLKTVADPPLTFPVRKLLVNLMKHDYSQSKFLVSNVELYSKS